MKTKPKPTAATPTARQARTARPKTAPKTPKRVKTRTTPSHRPETGWIEIAKEKPPKGLIIVAGNWDWARFYPPYWVVSNPFDSTRPFGPNRTHWIALPNPPARKCK